MIEEIRRRRLFGVLAIYFVAVWVTLQAADLMFPGWHIRDEAIRFVWIGAALLFPVALLFSWRYDISTNGIVKTPPTGDGHLPLNRADIGVLSMLGIVTLAICVGASAKILDLRGEPTIQYPIADIPENSIAVLPFANMSSNEDNEYFSDGITEQLLHELARVPDLHVAARTSAFFFKDRNEDIRTIGRQLGVRTVLEGSVQRSGNNVRITAQLINAEDGFHLWSDSYDRELDDVFAIQDEIAAAIVETLQIRLLARDEERLYRPASTTAEAFDLYLQAKAIRGTYTNEAVVRSNEMFAEVLEMAPNFANGYATLAYGYVLQSYYGSMTIEDAISLAEPLLDRALELAPDLEEAYAAWGLAYTRLAQFEDASGNFEKANENFERALQINPGYYSARFNYAFGLVMQSRLKEASASYLRAQALDPLNSNLNFNLGALLMLMGDYESGRIYMEKAIEINPDRVNINVALGVWSRRYGRLNDAIEFSQQFYVADPDNVDNNALRTRLQIDLGNIGEARAIIDDARSRAPDNMTLRNAEVNVWLAEENYDAIVAFAESEFALVDAVIGDPLTSQDKLRVHRYAWALLLGNNDDTAAENFMWAAGGEEGIRQTSYEQMETLKYLALAYWRLGRVEESNRLVEQCLTLANTANENGWATPQLYYRVAEIHAAHGDAVLATEFLTEAYELGWRDVVQLEASLFWKNIAGHPELERIMVMLYEDIIAQTRGDRI